MANKKNNFRNMNAVNMLLMVGIVVMMVLIVMRMCKSRGAELFTNNLWCPKYSNFKWGIV